MKMKPKSIRTAGLALVCTLPLMAAAAPDDRTGMGSRMAEQQRGAMDEPERGERGMHRDEDERFREREEALRDREERLQEREEHLREREEHFRDEEGDRRGMSPGRSDEEARDEERGRDRERDRDDERGLDRERDRDERRDRDEMPPGLADNPQAQERVREAQSQSERGKSGDRGNRPWWQFWGGDDDEEQPEN